MYQSNSEGLLSIPILFVVQNNIFLPEKRNVLKTENACL